MLGVEQQDDLTQDEQNRAAMMAQMGRLAQLAPRPDDIPAAGVGAGGPAPATPGGLNDQGYGAAALPLSPPGGGLPGLYRPLVPRADQQVVANPLTGILESAPVQRPTSPQNDPWVAQQVQNLERSMDLLGQNQQLSPFQRQHALAQKEQQIQQIDPQGIYRKGSPQSQMTAAQKWAGQNVFEHPDHPGLVFYHNGREWKAHELKPDQNDYHQKLLDLREREHKEAMDRRDAAHSANMDLLQKRMDIQGQQFDQRMEAFRTAHDQTQKVEEANRKHALNVYKHVSTTLNKPTDIQGPLRPGESRKAPARATHEQIMAEAKKIMPDIDKYVGGEAEATPQPPTGSAPATPSDPKQAARLGLEAGFGS